MRNVANVFTFYAINVFQCINIRQVPREVLKTEASGIGFQHLPRDLANVNAWKNMFDPYIKNPNVTMVDFILLVGTGHKMQLCYISPFR